MEEPGKTGAMDTTIVTEDPADAHIIVRFAENDLEAWGDFYPPMANGMPLDDTYVNSLIEKLNIVHGLNKESIQNAILMCNRDKKLLKNILIARGTPPINERLPYIQLNPRLGQNQVPGNDDKIDYRAYSPYIIVKKDQALAKQKSHKPGKNGMNIHGNPIPHGVTRFQGVEGAENTRMQGEFLLSNINGQMIKEKNVVSVRETLVIKGAVGYKTGNITFPGDVIIEGPVSDGFKLYAGGSITIKQTFDVTDAMTKGDLSVAGGIIGRGRAQIKVGGNLKTKFIENCRVACRKTIVIDTEIINSSIYTLESLEMGEKGRIVGGEIYAVRGIKAGAIGKKSAGPARIHCGIDFAVAQEKEKNNTMLRSLAAKLDRLRQLLEDPEIQGDKKAKLEEFRLRLEEEQRGASEKVSELMGRINTDENAAVEVLGEIAAGTLIEICQIALFVTEPLKKVKIRLDKSMGRLITEPL